MARIAVTIASGSLSHAKAISANLTSGASDSASATSPDDDFPAESEAEFESCIAHSHISSQFRVLADFCITGRIFTRPFAGCELVSYLGVTG
jgi:hypothetical protein